MVVSIHLLFFFWSKNLTSNVHFSFQPFLLSRPFYLEKKSLQGTLVQEIRDLVAEIETWECGTITVKEMCEIFFSKGLLPPAIYTTFDIEKEIIVELGGGEGSRELDTKEVIATFNFLLSRRIPEKNMYI